MKSHPCNSLSRITLALACAGLLSMAACGDDDGHGGTVHVQVTTAPAATATSGTAFDISWQVHNMTEEDLHHTEIRVCTGAGVTDCGLGAQGSYLSFTGTMDAGTFTAPVTLSTAGAHTLRAWAHVGEEPHVSDAYDIDVQ